MSYILDALRRAEAERDRGAVPGLHSQPTPGSAPAAPSAAPAGPWIAAGVGGALLLLGGLAWWLASPAPAPVPVPVTAAPAPPSAPAPAPAPTPAPPPVVVIMPAPAPAPAPVPVAPPPANAPPAPPVPAPAAAETRIVAFDQLPDDVKRQLPALAIGGAIYSERAADRLLIVSGQLLHEGDTVAPGVVLEKIKQRSAVLRWRELRYEITF